MSLINGMGCGYISVAGASTAGVGRLPYQPAFDVYLNANIANFCGNTGAVDIICNTANINNTIGTFGPTYNLSTGAIIPVGGTGETVSWIITASVWISNITAGNVAYLQLVNIAGTALSYKGATGSPTTSKDGSGNYGLTFSGLVYLPAGQSMKLQIVSTGEASNVQTLNGAAAPNFYTRISGFMLG